MAGRKMTLELNVIQPALRLTLHLIQRVARRQEIGDQVIVGIGGEGEVAGLFRIGEAAAKERAPRLDVPGPGIECRQDSA